MGTGATAGVPTGFRLSGSATPTWGDVANTTAVTAAAGTTGTGVLTGASGGGAHNFANGVTGTSAERALGFLNSGGFASPRTIMNAVTNNTGAPITSLTVSWRCEKYRSGQRAWDWTFFGSTDGSSWTAATAGNQSYAADANNTTIFKPPTQPQKFVEFTNLNIPNGSTYYLRWTLTGSGGSSNGQALAIDNLEVSAGRFIARDDARDSAYCAWDNADNGGSGWGGADGP